MSSFRVIFSTKKTKAQQLAEMKKDSSESSTQVDYIVPTERAGALHAALMPYIGKEKVNKKKGKMGRFAERMAYAGVSEAEKPVKTAVEPNPTPSMVAGGAAPPSDQILALVMIQNQTLTILMARLLHSLPLKDLRQG